jgi:hypothetical protein
MKLPDSGATTASPLVAWAWQWAWSDNLREFRQRPRSLFDGSAFSQTYLDAVAILYRDDWRYYCRILKALPRVDRHELGNRIDARLNEPPNQFMRRVLEPDLNWSERRMKRQAVPDVPDMLPARIDEEPRMKSIFELYDLLELEPNPDLDTVDAARRRRVAELHPDVNPDPDANEKTTAVNAAHDELVKIFAQEVQYIEQARNNVLLPVPPPGSVWPEDDKIDGAALLDAVLDQINRFCDLPRGAAEVVAVWVVYTFVYDAFDISPMLLIHTPLHTSGKTRLLRLLAILAHHAWAVSHTTAASVFRRITLSEGQITLLFDETDAYMARRDENMRAIIDSGYDRDFAYVERTIKNLPMRYSTWCPKAIAGIGRHHDTYKARSFDIWVQRAEDKMPSVGVLARVELRELGSKAAVWGKSIKGRLRAARPKMPDAFRHRVDMNWGVLFAIADQTGEEWGERIRKIAVDCVIKEGLDPKSKDAKELLLEDLYHYFEQETDDADVSSQELVTYLKGLEFRPWAYTPPFTTSDLAAKHRVADMLWEFEVHPCDIIRHNDGKRVTVKGYRLADCQSAFKRYLQSTIIRSGPRHRDSQPPRMRLVRPPAQRDRDN